MKTIEVEDGTEFLLCTDGITRHISDNEIRQLMVVSNNLEAVCDELKQRCYERGAEDNLTVVVVRVGEQLKSDERLADLEPTITPETQPVYAAQSGNGSEPESSFVPASRIAFPGASAPKMQRLTKRSTLPSRTVKQRQRQRLARLWFFLRAVTYRRSFLRRRAV